MDYMWGSAAHSQGACPRQKEDVFVHVFGPMPAWRSPEDPGLKRSRNFLRNNQNPRKLQRRWYQLVYEPNNVRVGTGYQVAALTGLRMDAERAA